jgi:hypothetical protein
MVGQTVGMFIGMTKCENREDIAKEGIVRVESTLIHPYLAAAYRRWKRDYPAKADWIEQRVAEYLNTPGPNDIDEFVGATDRLLDPPSSPPYTGGNLVRRRRSSR